ncbi:hypothetical protein [Mesoterricola silvestris]|uniref:Uncharacterized protein n=1 Tax=Mesoterricola silvestris TaxID=2927979 RepID=A0AA48GR33_9BACT|nr:hypothetical protein [Mesoterricola silvestris]BDU72675.1 hypothetical protein METEAL_18490 [Mesoterricola silvestris]
MKTPVFRFQEEVLTDAPLTLVRDRLQAGLPCLRACPGLHAPEVAGEGITLRWQHHALGAVEEGTLRAEFHEQGTHLRLDGRLRGWGAFLLLGWMRWRTDRLLDRIVKELP